MNARHSIMDMLEADGSIVSAGHFPDPGFGRLSGPKAASPGRSSRSNSSLIHPLG